MRMKDVVWAAAGAVLGAAVLVAEDVPAMFNLKVEQAQGYVVSVMHGGRFDWSGYQYNFKKATGEARLALINSVAGWAKAYTESEAFATQYANQRKRLEPRPPFQREPADKILARQKADIDVRIAAEKRRLEMAPPRNQTPEQIETARKAAEQRLKDLETRLAPFNDPKLFAEMRTKLETQAATEKQEYDTARAKWDEQYPADFRTLIAKRLHAFLSETADVDFAAKLVPCTSARFAGLRCFANPAYESKSADWKISYRAGKPSLDAARAVATNWLAEIEKK